MSDDALIRRVPGELAGLRLDQALARLFPDYSRSRLQRWIGEGRVTVDGLQPRPRDAVRGGEEVFVLPRLDAVAGVESEPLPLDLVFEDEEILIVNKPPDLVVHPGAGNRSGTLVNALVHYAPELEVLPRAGLVHRLDKDTSGLLVVARTARAHRDLVEQLQRRSVKRVYAALVRGTLVAGGRIDQPIGRHPVQRTRMAVVPGGKPAVTHYRVARRFGHYTLLRVRLETGRTHQIRVHLAQARYPIVGDPVYGARPRLPPACSNRLAQALRGFRRQALHAERLGFRHPADGREMEWCAPPPEDLSLLLRVLDSDDPPAVS